MLCTCANICLCTVTHAHDNDFVMCTRFLCVRLCIDCECGTKRNGQFSIISFEWDLIQYLQSKASSSVHTLIGAVTKLSQTFSFSNFIPTFYNHQYLSLSLSFTQLVAFDLLSPSHFSCNIDFTSTHTHQNRTQLKHKNFWPNLTSFASLIHSDTPLVYLCTSLIAPMVSNYRCTAFPMYLHTSMCVCVYAHFISFRSWQFIDWIDRYGCRWSNGVFCNFNES